MSKFTVSVLMPVWNQEELVLKALQSIPPNVDEVIIVDDGSTDNTPEILRDWAENKPYVRIITNEKNMGVGYSINRCYDNATKDYHVILSSDDYFHPQMQQIIEQVDGSDMVFFNLTYNVKNRVRKPNEKNYRLWAGSCKLVRREFMEDVRASDAMVNEDVELYQKLLEKPHTVQFTNIFGKHYNTPRAGSLTDLKQKGKFGKKLVTTGHKHWKRYDAENFTENGEPITLTLQHLKDMPRHIVFARGITTDDAKGINMTRSGKQLRWVAKRGEIHDWAIYIHWAEYDEEYVKAYGDKVTSKDHIKKLVPCDDEAFGMYRY